MKARVHAASAESAKTTARRIDLSRCKLLGPYGLDASQSVGPRGIKMGRKPLVRPLIRES